MRIRAGMAPLLALVMLTVAVPVSAEARLKTVVVRHGPFTIDPYEVRYTSRANRRVRAPRINGYIVRMYARVVDKRGRRIPVRRVMLHHVLYKNLGRFPGDRTDGICGGKNESFYGTGEENQALRLPEGYGYRIRKRDRWKISWMLMNHRNRTDKAYVEYRAVVETRRKLRHVDPYWIRVTGCEGASDPIFNVPGGQPRGSTVARSLPFQFPRSGRLVAANGHVHGGSRDLVISQPRCGNRSLMRSKPLYGLRSHPYYNVLPVLHEPGPIATTWPMTRTGIPIGPQEPLRLTSNYDAELPHTRVMGIMHAYVDHSRQPTGFSCGPLPSGLTNRLPNKPGRRRAPRFWVPLTGLDSRGRARTISRPPGPVRYLTGNAEVGVAGKSYFPSNLSIPLGAAVNWRSYDRRWHNVTLANGPEGFGSPMLVRGASYVRRFSKPGFYRNYCTLHPITMTQAIEVRPGS